MKLTNLKYQFESDFVEPVEDAGVVNSSYPDRQWMHRVQFWAILGPFALLLSFFISLVKASPQTIYLELAAVLGIPVCWRWKQKGLMASLAAMGVVLVCIWGQVLPGEGLWMLGYVLALALGLGVAALGFEEARSELQRRLSKEVVDEPAAVEPEVDQVQLLRLKQDAELREAKIHSLENAVLAHQAELGSMQELVREIQNQNKLESSGLEEQILQRERTIIEQEKVLRGVQGDLWTIRSREKKLQDEYHLEMQRQMAMHQESIREWKSKEAQVHELLTQKESNENELTASLFRAKREMEKAQHMIHGLEEEKNRLYSLWQHESAELEQLKKWVEEQQLDASKQAEPVSAVCGDQKNGEEIEQQMLALRHTEALYKQLKKQFEEKTDVLAKTRAELFHLEVNHLAVLREQEAKLLMPDPVQERLLDDLMVLEQECRQQELEIEQLQDLVSVLVGQGKDLLRLE